MSESKSTHEERGATDLLVKTTNPARLDQSLLDLGKPALMAVPRPGEYVQRDGAYVVRCYTEEALRLVRSVITTQGWGEVVGELDELV